MLHKLLKEATKGHIAETQKVLHAQRLFSPDYSLEEYRQHLRHLLAAHASVERGIMPYMDYLREWQFDVPLNSHILRKDFHDLHLNGKPDPPIKEVSYDNPWQCIGAIYVVRNSMLSRAVIADRVAHRIQYFHRNPPLYYTGTTQDLSEWESYLDTLDSLSASAKDEVEMCQGAIKSFQLFW